MRQSTHLVITGYRPDEVKKHSLQPRLEQLLGGPVTITQFEQSEFLFDGGISVLVGGVDVRQYRSVLLYGRVKQRLRLAYPLALALKSLGINVITSNAERYRGVDKLSQYVELSQLHIPLPKSYFGPPERILQQAEPSLGLPLVIKDILAAHGDRNFLIKDADSLQAHAALLRQHRFIAQEYIQADSDMRILMNAAGNWFAFARRAEKGHLHNTSKGAMVTQVDNLRDDVLQWCRQIVKQSGYSLVGIDVIYSIDNRPYFLEVNTSPALLNGALLEQKQAWLRSTLQ